MSLGGMLAAESEGNQITEGHVRPDSRVNRKNRSWYLVSIYYVAGTMLSTLEYSTILLNLPQNTINPILQIMAMTVREVTSLQQATQAVKGRWV